ncbi:hypothetical protein QN404_05205 [Pseudomonas sp. RTS1]|uniref:hypothetical protein n=1 Tax=unclassified Pseudomonas TaxID=196821 RepID=UPI002B227C37|nr:MULTISPECIES: hypothetical protein [unclassified Pseudomonas]MEA9988285.1 hypothetical protein [Pseudomonas sp. RTS1]MEB0035768.1 hypothetical protein [Pseudomonas sp. RTS2]MEB0237555.1 hypothetical protein [Pseudomonas sp. 5S3]MEB0252313.1 hypothetical protein [Pseudomonas sp. 5S2]
MPINQKTVASSECEFSEWEIDPLKEDNLVEIVAYLYLRQEENAQRVIGQVATQRVEPFGNVVANVIRKLGVLSPTDPSNTADQIKNSRIHRDGLLFQHISWVVTRISIPSGVMTSPHVRQADKGFDGFVLELDEKKEKVDSIIISEDKASAKPRKLITSKVWPELKQIIDGERDDEILAELVTLLKGVEGVNKEGAIGRVVWAEARRFRVCIATGENIRDTVSGSFEKLMNGFSGTVSGAMSSRTGGVLAFKDVRDGLDEFALAVIEKVKEIDRV